MNNTKNIVIKILILGAVFSLLIYFISGMFFNTAETGIENNKENFKNINNEIVGSTGVAVTTSIGTRHSQIASTPATLYKDVMNINYILANKQLAKNKIISTNMRATNEYLNILKTDIKLMLANSSDRLNTLNFFIDQLKYRHNNAIDNVNNLKEQISLLQTNIEKSETKIESIKAKIEKDFKNFDSANTLENIDDYLKQREIYTYSYTYVIFINKFINQYAYLNKKTKLLVDTLEQNKEALVKNATIVLPESGIGLLDDLDLIKN